jgi:quercetin dioxygenase-like cupin family protein
MRPLRAAASAGMIAPPGTFAAAKASIGFGRSWIGSVPCSIIKEWVRAAQERPALCSLHQEKTMTTTRMMAIAACLMVGSGSMLHVAQAQDAGMAGVKRTDLQRHDLSASGREVIQVRVDLAPGVAFPKHRHPGEEIIYVLEGSLEYEVEGKPPVTLKAGDVLFIPAGTVHAAKNVGSGNGGELATYIVEKGKPLVELVK